MKIKPKGLFSYFEFIFDIFYLVTAFVISAFILIHVSSTLQLLAGIMAFILAAGDSFHLIPRIFSIYTKDSLRFQKQLSIGKLITSITMTIFYALLWEIGIQQYHPLNISACSLLVYTLAIIRIVLCLMPQNKWTTGSSYQWGIWRNIPFVLLGLVVTGLFFHYRQTIPHLWSMWLAITLSFLFYIPVVLWSHKKPVLGMLMLPKSCMYLWILYLCIYL